MFNAYYDWVGPTFFGPSFVPFGIAWGVLACAAVFVVAIMFFSRVWIFEDDYDRVKLGVASAVVSVCLAFPVLLVVLWAWPFLLGMGVLVGLAWLCVRGWREVQKDLGRRK